RWLPQDRRAARAARAARGGLARCRSAVDQPLPGRSRQLSSGARCATRSLSKRTRSRRAATPGVDRDRRALSRAGRRLDRSMETTVKTLAADSAVSAERALNAAIVNADITRGFEEYLTLVDQYYADDVEVSTGVSPHRLVGKSRLKSLLLGFLVPLHMIAEMGGLWVSIH